LSGRLMSAERLEVFILDASYEVVGNEPHVILWAVDSSGRRIVLRDRSFRPYFYVLPSEDYQTRLEQLMASLRRLSKPKSPITRISVVDRKYYGKPVKVLRVETLIPEFVREYREEVKRIEGVKEVLEADIRFAMRYLIDMDVYPSSWYEVEAVYRGKPADYRADAEYEVAKIIGKIDRVKPPELRVMAFDIEVYNPRGSPNPIRDPVIIIALATHNEGVIQLTAQGKDDRSCIRSFVEEVQRLDPDIIVGYNSNKFDWPYLMERARALGIKLDVGRKRGGEPRTSVYGHVSLPGRIHLDLYNFAEEMPEIKVKSLDEVAEYLGIMRREERVNIPWFEIYKYWDDEEKRKLLLQYSKDDVVSTLGIANKLLPFGLQLSSVTGIPLDQVMAASVGFRLEWYLMRVAFKRGELVPNRIEREYETYKGAIVLEPVKGVHENIAVLDFSAMYPSIMMKYNVGPDTLDREGVCDAESVQCNIAPEVNHTFVADPPGFFKSALETLVRARKIVREQMKTVPPDSIEYKLLDERQKALKILANAAYGYMGWTGARWYCRECAEAVTAWGRATIRRAIDIARSLGLKVIYGDTDSLFVTYIPDLVNKLIDAIALELGLEIKIDKVYQRVFFTEAKKRYIGLTTDGKIDVVGFEAVRGDWAEIAKDMQELVASVLLKTMDPKKAVEVVREELEKMRRSLESGAVSIDKFVIWKTITKPLNEYEVDAPHVAAAKMLLKMGYPIDVGDKIGYVVVKGSGKISERVKPYMFADVRELDLDYYIDHQIIPAVLRILEYFGISDKQLKGVGKAGKTLFSYTKK